MYPLSQEANPPLIVTRSSRINNSPSRVFTVPDDCSTDENLEENEAIDDSIPHGTSSTLGKQEVAEHNQENCPPEMRLMDGATEFGSDYASDDHISISSDDDVDLNGAHHDDDDESISLSDDEEMSSEPASPIESLDMDDTIQMDDDGTRSLSWNRVSTDSESEHTDENSPSHRPVSDDEQGVFLYDSDSDEMDELDDDDPIDDDFDPSTRAVNPPGPFFQAPPLLGCVAPVLPPLSAAVFSQPQYSDIPFGYQLPPVVRPVPRQPSPSDAVLPLSHRHHGSEDDGAVAVEDLGHKWGKPDFFEAREHNKMTISRLTGPNTTSEASMVPDAATKTTNDATLEESPLRSSVKGWEEHVASSTTEMDNPSGPEPSQGDSWVGRPEQITERQVEAQEPLQWSDEAHEQTSQCFGSQALPDFQPSQPARSPSWLRSGEVFLNTPLPKTPVRDLATTPVAEALDWTPASAYELHEYKQQKQAQQEQDSEARGDSADNPFAACSPMSKDSSQGKRKAVEISETTNDELAWHDDSKLMRPLTAPSSPAMQPEPDASLPSPPTTPGSDARPSKKIRKIAERVGYAALGGATVGAMVFTSLIYTAPSFA